MRIKDALSAAGLVAAVWMAASTLWAQRPTVDPASVIPMNKEPHHHLVFHNDYVNVYDVKVAAGDSIKLHRHDHDALAIAIGDQDLTVGIPGKPDVHQITPDGQMRLQVSGYMHSTHVDGAAAYHTVAVELLLEQTGKRNLCAAIMGGQPLNCPENSQNTSSTKEIIQPQFQSNQTRIQVVRVPPHQKVDVGSGAKFQLIVALDPASISPAPGKTADQMLGPGDFVWLDKGGPSRIFKNVGEKEVRFVDLEFTPIRPSNQSLYDPGDRLWTVSLAGIGMELVKP